MDPQPVEEGKQVLSDIEQSIQNALALFNSKDLGEGIDQLYVIDDPIVSLHDTKNKDETSNSCKPEITQNKPSPVTEADTDSNQQYYDALPFTNITMPNEFGTLPFLENPIQHTIQEMQRVLNAKEDVFSPRKQPQPRTPLSSPPQRPPLPPYQSQPSPPYQSQPSPPYQSQPLPPGQSQSSPPQPSPEELLNLYSQDLGISLSPNLSPRGDMERNLIESDLLKAKQIKKDKKSPKKPKHPKTIKEKKTETKKGKSVKSENMVNRDVKMRELMNIYGCGDKMNLKKSDSTLGSKSGVSRNASMRKLSSANNISSNASIAVSRKTKKLKYKFTNDLNIKFSDGDLAPLEKSSRLSTKRKIKQKNSNVKPIKKPNLKRKIVGKSSADDVELKLSKSYQNPTRNRTYEDQKSKSVNKEFDDNYKNQRKQTIQKPNNRKPKDFIKLNKQFLSVNSTESFSTNENVTVLDAIPTTKEYVNKNKSCNQDVQSEKHNSFSGKPSQVTDFETNKNILNKKVSEEKKTNKQVALKDVNHYHTYKVENKETISDFSNEAGLEHPSQFHYLLPTHSSRSKEVDRFLHGNYQHLPFVIGQSVNKSHNLWVNIQEALSLIKHNIPTTIEIHSVQDKESERPLSVLSKLTVKSKKPHQCPALMNDGLYDIPETSAEGEDAAKAWEDHPDCIQANLDPNFSKPRCSCFPQATLSYKKVLRQIFGGGEDSLDLNRARDDYIDHGGDSYTAELRKVLIAFTQEFEDLNNKYEELLSDPNSSKEELQRLEMYLETKEEEIREIIARINEVKELNERSRGELQGRGASGLEPYKSTTSVQLWQTLRRVQQFKEDILSKPGGRHTSRVSCAKSLY